MAQAVGLLVQLSSPLIQGVKWGLQKLLLPAYAPSSHFPKQGMVDFAQQNPILENFALLSLKSAATT